MHTHPNGLPLDSVNAVSAPTTGALDIFYGNHPSPLLASPLVDFNLFALVLSVSAESILVNVDNSTFLIGSSFLVDNGPGYVVDISSAQNPHSRDNSQSQRIQL